MSSPIIPQQLIECEVCNTVQMVDLNEFDDEPIICTACAAPLPLDDLRALLRKHQAQAAAASMRPAQVSIHLGTNQQAAAEKAIIGGISSCVFVMIFVGIAFTVGLVAVLSIASNSIEGMFEDVGISTKSLSPAGRLHGHSSYVNVLAYSPDGRYLASGGDDEIVRLWDLTTGESLILLVADRVADVAFSPDGTLLAATTRDDVNLWSVPDGKPINRQFSDYYFDPGAVVFSPDSKWLAFSDSDTAIWDVQTGQKIIDIESNLPAALVFNADGTQLITLETNDAPMIWDTGRGLLLKTLEVETGFEAFLSLTADGQKLVYFGDDVIVIYDMLNDTFRTITPETFFSPDSLAISPDGQYLAMSDMSDTLLIIEEANGNTLYNLETNGILNDVAFSPDGSSISAAGRDGIVYLWILFEEEQQVTLQLTPSQTTCMITANVDVRLSQTPGEEAIARTMSKDYQAEVDGQRSVSDVIWWHLASGGWARSDFVTANEHCNSVERK